ncbi:MAG: ABC transporter permease [Clostridiales bacterium]|jgi:ABC-2 type transport system permease protein|nr:ABC transporter permease [Clostridiales bacterium]
MRAVSAIFIKQLNDFPKNISVAFLFVMYPILAAVMSFFIPVEEGGGGFFTMTFAMMFVGSTPMISVANTIAEDNEYKSLRFLVMAGVRPGQYMLGLGAFVMIMSLLPLAAFALIGGYGFDVLAVFIPVALLGCICSLVLGGVVGLFSKNVQQCAAIYTPLMLVISFVPFLATFNEGISNVAQILFTYHIFLIFVDAAGATLYDNFSLPVSMAVIAANALVFAVLFAIAYKKKGLKG